MQNFEGQTRCNFGDLRVANTKFCEAEKVYHGRFESGKYSYPCYKFAVLVFLIIFQVQMQINLGVERITSEGPVSKRYETGIESSESTLNLIHKAFDTYFLFSLAYK